MENEAAVQPPVPPTGRETRFQRVIQAGLGLLADRNPPGEEELGDALRDADLAWRTACEGWGRTLLHGPRDVDACLSLVELGLLHRLRAIADLPPIERLMRLPRYPSATGWESYVEGIVEWAASAQRPSSRSERVEPIIRGERQETLRRHRLRLNEEGIRAASALLAGMSAFELLPGQPDRLAAGHAVLQAAFADLLVGGKQGAETIVDAVRALDGTTAAWPEAHAAIVAAADRYVGWGGEKLGLDRLVPGTDVGVRFPWDHRVYAGVVVAAKRRRLPWPWVTWVAQRHDDRLRRDFAPGRKRLVPVVVDDTLHWVARPWLSTPERIRLI